MSDRPTLHYPADLVQTTVRLPFDGPVTLGCGSDSGTTFCVAHNRQALVSGRFADLARYETYREFTRSVDALLCALRLRPTVAAHDLHPDYCSTRYAVQLPGVELEPVQHHHAHTVACMVENNIEGPVIGVAFDGMGLGSDGTLWGGEFLVCGMTGFNRAAHFKQYPLPGGDQATLYPERFAFSCLHSEFDGDTGAARRLLPGIEPAAAETLGRMLGRGVRCPITSSAGRLFDAVSALLGFRGPIASPGAAAIQLQAWASDGVSGCYGYVFQDGVLDFGRMLREIVSDVERGVDRGRISAMFHNTLAAAGADVCERIAAGAGTGRVTLSGGVFLNGRLKASFTEELHRRGLEVYTHRLLPPGDACISLGQAVVATARRKSDVSGDSGTDS